VMLGLKDMPTAVNIGQPAAQATCRASCWVLLQATASLVHMQGITLWCAHAHTCVVCHGPYLARLTVELVCAAAFILELAHRPLGIDCVSNLHMQQPPPPAVSTIGKQALMLRTAQWTVHCRTP
jgi:hypothetical protein